MRFLGKDESICDISEGRAVMLIVVAKMAESGLFNLGRPLMVQARSAGYRDYQLHEFLPHLSGADHITPILVRP